MFILEIFDLEELHSVEGTPESREENIKERGERWRPGHPDPQGGCQP
jgi:hypothetical protein